MSKKLPSHQFIFMIFFIPLIQSSLICEKQIIGEKKGCTKQKKKRIKNYLNLHQFIPNLFLQIIQLKNHLYF